MATNTTTSVFKDSKKSESVLATEATFLRASVTKFSILSASCVALVSMFVISFAITYFIFRLSHSIMTSPISTLASSFSFANLLCISFIRSAIIKV